MSSDIICVSSVKGGYSLRGSTYHYPFALNSQVQLTGETDHEKGLAALHAAGPAVIALTMGPAGCTVSCKEGSAHCPTYNTMGKAACDAKRIPEETLMNAAADALGLEQFDSEIFLDQISVVKVEKANRLLFIFKDGRERMIHWQDRSRSESWTWEMRDAARRRAEERSDAYA